MDKTQLQQKLTQPFDSNHWKEVVETVFPGSQFYSQERVIDSKEEIVEQIADKGTVRLADGKNIALVELRLKPGSVHLHRNRVKLRSLVAKLIDQERAHGVIAVFEQGEGDYRLSFVAREAVLEDGEFKVRETPAKRFTYLLGPGETCRTAAERLYTLSQKQELTLDDITDAFSVEKLNKEFYRHIQKYFYKLIGGKTERTEEPGCMTLPDKPIEEQENHKAYSEFAVRLIGRIVFCWFLKHKRCDQDRPLIPNELLSSEAVEKHSGYYHSVLEKLFFQTLNKPMNERSKYAPAFAHLIPYLNGGLFDPHKDDFYEEGVMGESKAINTLLIPDDWFRELFQTLEQYNFTIDENTALDADVSIDPEILGRIFENLLAEINPETGDSARKATGSFYTPREIVDYMVEESLIQHLKTALGLSAPEGGSGISAAGPESAPSQLVMDEKLRALFIDDDSPHNLDDKTRRAVVDAFRTIKVLDPACGSGAFPVGILQKMLCALRKVDEDNDLWLQAQIDQIHDMKLSKQEENRRLDEIDHAFKTNEADYGRKLGIIQNSVYGVDIQPIAIEISKLRFFLTLVVDEKINEKEDNRGILPLPNLDFKFVCANTLIPAPEIESVGELGLEFEDSFFDDFTALTEQYFYAGTPSRKQDIREKLERVVSTKVKSELNRAHDRMGGENLFRKEHLSLVKQKKMEREKANVVRDIRLWGSYKKIFTGETVGFFDPKYMFPDAGGGFDVVIGNPPYVRSRELFAKAEKEIYSKLYPLIQYQLNLYKMFFLKADALLRQNGILCMITPSEYLNNDYDKNLRRFFIKERTIRQFVLFYENIFTANVSTLITLIGKTEPSVASSFLLLKEADFWGQRNTAPLSQSDFNNPDLNYVINPNADGLTLSICSKIQAQGIRVQDLVTIKNGIKVRKELLSDTQLSSAHVPFVRGRNLAPYHICKSPIFMDYDLEKEKKYSNQAFRSRDIFEQKKIIVRQVFSGRIYAVLDTKCIYVDQTAYVLIKPKGITLKLLTAILMSKVMSYFFINTFSDNKTLFPKIKGSQIKLLPIKIPEDNLRKNIEKRVEKILALKKKNPEADMTELEAEIDQLVYKLYDLTEEEIRIIDPDYQSVAVAPPVEEFLTQRYSFDEETYAYRIIQQILSDAGGQCSVNRAVFAYALLADKKLLRRFDPNNTDRWLAAFDQKTDIRMFRTALERLIRDGFVQWKGDGLNGHFELHSWAKPETEECIKQDAAFALKIAEAFTDQLPDDVIQKEASVKTVIQGLKVLLAA